MTFKVGDPKPPNAGRRAGTPNKRMAHKLMERGLPLHALGIDKPDENVIAGEGHSGDDVPPVGSNGKYFRG